MQDETKPSLPVVKTEADATEPSVIVDGANKTITIKEPYKRPMPRRLRRAYRRAIMKKLAPPIKF